MVCFQTSPPGGFLLILRLFKVGDLIQAGGVLGVVDDIGLFINTINTPDNIKMFVGNGKIFNDNIQNFSANAFRRVDLVAQLNHSVDPNQHSNGGEAFAAASTGAH